MLKLLCVCVRLNVYVLSSMCIGWIQMQLSVVTDCKVCM